MLKKMKNATRFGWLAVGAAVALITAGCEVTLDMKSSYTLQGKVIDQSTLRGVGGAKVWYKLNGKWNSVTTTKGSKKEAAIDKAGDYSIKLPTQGQNMPMVVEGPALAKDGTGVVYAPALTTYSWAIGASPTGSLVQKASATMNLGLERGLTATVILRSGADGSALVPDAATEETAGGSPISIKPFWANNDFELVGAFAKQDADDPSKYTVVIEANRGDSNLYVGSADINGDGIPEFESNGITFTQEEKAAGELTRVVVMNPLGDPSTVTSVATTGIRTVCGAASNCGAPRENLMDANGNMFWTDGVTPGDYRFQTTNPGGAFYEVTQVANIVGPDKLWWNGASGSTYTFQASDPDPQNPGTWNVVQDPTPFADTLNVVEAGVTPVSYLMNQPVALAEGSKTYMTYNDLAIDAAGVNAVPATASVFTEINATAAVSADGLVVSVTPEVALVALHRVTIGGGVMNPMWDGAGDQVKSMQNALTPRTFTVNVTDTGIVGDETALHVDNFNSSTNRNVLNEAAGATTNDTARQVFVVFPEPVWGTMGVNGGPDNIIQSQGVYLTRGSVADGIASFPQVVDRAVEATVLAANTTLSDNYVAVNNAVVGSTYGAAGFRVGTGVNQSDDFVDSVTPANSVPSTVDIRLNVVDADGNALYGDFVKQPVK